MSRMKQLIRTIKIRRVVDEAVCWIASVCTIACVLTCPSGQLHSKFREFKLGQAIIKVLHSPAPHVISSLL